MGGISANDFYVIASTISKDSHVFIDVHIGDVNGLDIAAKLNEMGFMTPEFSRIKLRDPIKAINLYLEDKLLTAIMAKFVFSFLYIDH